MTPTKEATTTPMDTITITIPQVKINLDISDITFDTLENTVFHTVQHVGRKSLEKVLFDIDEKLRETRSKGVLENTGKREKYFSTRLGDIRYRRTRYVDMATRGSRYLLEEHLGMRKNQRMSLMRAKVEILLASLTTYRGAEKNLEVLTGFRRSHEAVRQSVIKEAEEIIRHQEYALEEAKRLKDSEDERPPGHDIAYVESDATFIRYQRRRKRRVRFGGVYRRKKKRRKSLEVKLGIGYTDKVKRYDAGGGRGLKLKDKFTYVSVRDSGKCFMENLSCVAEKKLSLSRVKGIIFGGDGGLYITGNMRDYFPGAVYVLSRFHLKRAIRTALAGRPVQQKAVERLVRKDKIEKVLCVIGRLCRRSKDVKERKLLRDLYTYICNNRDGINTIKRIEDKRVRDAVKGAGAIESNVDKFIAHRFKKRGMSWSVRGAQGLLKVKEIIANNEWEEWWSGRRDAKVEIDLEPLRQLTAKQVWKKESDKPPLLEMTLPALQGCNHDEPWAKVLRELQTIDYYK